MLIYSYALLFIFVANNRTFADTEIVKQFDEFDNRVKRKVIFLNIFSNLVQLAGMDADEKYADFPTFPGR